MLGKEEREGGLNNKNTCIYKCVRVVPRAGRIQSRAYHTQYDGTVSLSQTLLAKKPAGTVKELKWAAWRRATQHTITPIANSPWVLGVQRGRARSQPGCNEKAVPTLLLRHRGRLQPYGRQHRAACANPFLFPILAIICCNACTIFF